VIGARQQATTLSGSRPFAETGHLRYRAPTVALASGRRIERLGNAKGQGSGAQNGNRA